MKSICVRGPSGLSYIWLWCFCLVAYVAAGQSRLLPADPLQERLIGNAGQEEFHAAVVNWRGDIATVGTASPGREGGQDILLAIFDAQLNLLVERHIGRSGDDGAYSISTLPDGRYIIAGYSTAPNREGKIQVKYAGQRDGWLLVLDEHGNIEHELVRGTAENDAFVAALACVDGSIWVAGNSGNAAWVLRLNRNLDVLWEQRIHYHHLPTRAYSACLTRKGDFYIVGNIEEADRQQAWLIGFDPQGKQTLEKTYPHTIAQRGAFLRELSDSYFVMAANTYSPDNREQGAICVLSKTGEHLHYLSLGGREFDQLHFAYCLSNDYLLVGGSSASLERGSRRLSGWAVVLEPQLPAFRELQTRYYGSKLNDEIHAFVEHPDGRLFAFGTTSRQVLRLRQGWLLQLWTRNQKKNKTEELSLQLGEPLYPENRTFLFERERLILPINIRNIGKNPAHNLIVRVSTSDPILQKYLYLPGLYGVQVEPIPSSRENRLPIPISLASGVPAGEYQLQVQLFQEDTPIGPPQYCTIRTGKRNTP